MCSHAGREMRATSSCTTRQTQGEVNISERQKGCADFQYS